MGTTSTADPKVKKKAKFGQRAMKAGYATKEQLQECLKLQKRYKKKGGKVPRIGELLVHKGYMSKDQVAEVLKKMHPEDAAEAPETVEEAPEPKKKKKKRSRELPRFDPGTEYADGFMMEERLGDDPLGDVYLARQSAKERPALMVVVDPANTSDKSFKKLLVDRMKVMARLDHPNVQKLYAFGKSKGCYYAGLEYCRGDLAEEKLKARKPQDYTFVMQSWAQLIDALRALHASGLTHADLHPRNVSLSKDGGATLMRCGTPLMRDYHFGDWPRMAGVYTAPEVLRGDEPTPASDVFGLGALIYHMFTGTAAWRANSVEEAIESVEKGAPSVKKHNGRVPNEVADLIDKMIAADPARRPTDLARLKRDVSKLPQDIQTRVAVNYASVLGKGAMQQPSTGSAKVPGSQTSTRRAGSTTQSDRSPQKTKAGGKSTKTMNYSQLVAQMNKDAVTEAKEEAAGKRSSSRTSIADLAKSGGKAYRSIDNQEKKGLPKQVVMGLMGAGVVCAIAAAGFYFWSKKVQNEKNAETARLVEERRVKDEPVHVKPVEVEQRKNRAQLRIERAIKQHGDVLRDFKRMGKFDRKKLEHLIRMTNGTIAQGRKGWMELGDAYNLLGRLEYYWAYTDRHGRIQTSVKKDHVSLAMAALKRAKAFYSKPDAESSLRLTVHPWMPEYREPTTFCHASKLKGGRRVREVRTKDRKYALTDLEVFLAGVKKNPF